MFAPDDSIHDTLEDASAGRGRRPARRSALRIRLNVARAQAHRYARAVLPVLVFLVLIALVALVSRRGTGKRVRISSCCGARPWPPDDLAARPPAAPDVHPHESSRTAV